MIHVAPLHTAHVDVLLVETPLTEARLETDAMFSAVSEKHGETNSGYLVARLEHGGYWCACDDFRFNHLDGDELTGTCKHIDAVRKRTREATEADQATLFGGSDADTDAEENT